MACFSLKNVESSLLNQLGPGFLADMILTEKIFYSKIDSRS
jgi:hypothetical protein